MNKWLFTDGTNGVKELQSQEELRTEIWAAPNPDKIRIWTFSSNEWISYSAFQKKYPFIVKKEMAVASVSTAAIPVRTSRGKLWLKKFLFVSGAAAGVFLIFNFTKMKWTKAAPVNITAARPSNVPLMDIDSLITTIEFDILDLIVRSAGRVISRHELTAAIHQRPASPLDRSLDVHVSHIRKKLGPQGDLIRTVRGVGYLFRAELLEPSETGG